MMKKVIACEYWSAIMTAAPQLTCPTETTKRLRGELAIINYRLIIEEPGNLDKSLLAWKFVWDIVMEQTDLNEPRTCGGRGHAV